MTTTIPATQQGASSLIMSAQGKTASEAFTPGEFVQLGRHLNNGNAKSFTIGYRDTGKPKYTRPKARTEETALRRAYDSTKESCWKPMTFAPHSSNRNGMSRWGALDFDGHDEGDVERAREWAFRCWQSLLNQVPCAIIEHSGRGWHVWTVWPEFKAASWINHLLKTTALDAGCEIAPGQCEVFPEAGSTGLGKPLRLPGTFNPATGRCSIILNENVHASEVLNSLYVRFGAFSRINLTNVEKNDITKVSIYRAWADSWQEQFAIKFPRTRNDLLTKLVYEIFNQVSHEQAEYMAGLQFDLKHVTTNANRAEHLGDFKAIWAGLDRNFVDSLGAEEAAIYESFRRKTQRDKFRIVRGWARCSTQNGHDVFPLSITSLAERVDEKIPSVSAFRNLLIDRGALHQVEGFVAGVKCGRYRWLLSEKGK